MNSSSTVLLRRRLGAYYTPSGVAEFMAAWMASGNVEHIIEPSFGDGTFLRALAGIQARLNSQLHITAVEIDSATVKRARASGALPSHYNVYEDDFLAIAPFPADGVIGNPPYVRLRHLSPSLRNQALRSACGGGIEMEPSGSLWMPFVLHSMRFLKPGGRMAFVLPQDSTYVRYARPLWRRLGAQFGSVTILRVHERPFPDILQDVVLLFADNFGSSSGHVRYKAFNRLADLYADEPIVSASLDIEDIAEGERSFTHSHLSAPAKSILRALDDKVIPVSRLVRFNIGYVTGDKQFFHPSELEIEAFTLPSASLRPSLTSARQMRGAGLWSSSLGDTRTQLLFRPRHDVLTKGEREYIKAGELGGVSLRYKCSVREPWYIVPHVRTPDLLVSVFSEQPVLMVNDAALAASNSILCGFSLGSDPKRFAAAWYTSLTLLSLELEIHSLGGGVMVLIPGEVGRIRVPKDFELSENHLQELNEALMNGDVSAAYRCGDAHILPQLGLSTDDIEVIRRDVTSLQHWRNSARTQHSGASDATRKSPKKAFGH